MDRHPRFIREREDSGSGLVMWQERENNPEKLRSTPDFQGKGKK